MGKRKLKTVQKELGSGFNQNLPKSSHNYSLLMFSFPILGRYFQWDQQHLGEYLFIAPKSLKIVLKD